MKNIKDSTDKIDDKKQTLYEVVNETVTKSSSYKVVTVKLSDTTVEELDEFLSKNKALRKQDVISTAINRLIKEFSD